MATATGEAEEDWEEDWEVGTEKVAEKVKETLLYSLSEASKVVLSRTNFEDFSKDCSKKISKDFNFAVKSGTRKRTQRDTVQAERNTWIQYTHE